MYNQIEELNFPPASKSGSGPRLLLALDGSGEGEAALQPAFKLAEQLGATLYLLRIEEAFTTYEARGFLTDYGLLDSGEFYEDNQKRREKAYSYLEKVQARYKAREVPSVKVVRIGDPVSEIVKYCSQIQPELLIMTRPAGSRVGPVLSGSVVEGVLRRTHLPVMIVPPASSRE